MTAVIMVEIKNEGEW